jgi:RimJ/RimL family protein N-acetyltransferase
VQSRGDAAHEIRPHANAPRCLYPAGFALPRCASCPTTRPAAIGVILPPVHLPSPVLVRGNGVVLREWTDHDVPAMVALLDDPEIDQWTPIQSPFDAEAAARYLARARARRREGRALQLAVTTDGDAPLGEVLLFDPARGAAELGYAIGAAHRGRGLARASVLALVDHAAAEYGLQRFLLRIPPGNAASRAVARSAGFELTRDPLVARAAKGRRVELETWSLRPPARPAGSAPR